MNPSFINKPNWTASNFMSMDDKLLAHTGSITKTLKSRNFHSKTSEKINKPTSITTKSLRQGTAYRFSPSQNRFLYTFRDPGSKPLCDKAACFEKNFSHLPEKRLKLIVNKKILRMDEEAIERIAQKLAEEKALDFIKTQKSFESRQDELAATGRRKRQTEDLQARTGLIKYKSEAKFPMTSSKGRIQALAQPKTLKVGYAEDYIDSYGLLKAGVLQPGKSVLPRSARIPLTKVINPFLLPESESMRNSSRIVSCDNFARVTDIYSDREILECMKEINDFNSRIGKRKERVGFGQIDLERFKEKKSNTVIG